MRVKHAGICGERGDLLSTEVGDAAACSALAQGAGAQSFILGMWFRSGYRYTGTVQVASALRKMAQSVQLSRSAILRLAWVMRSALRSRICLLQLMEVDLSEREVTTIPALLP